MSSQVVVIDDKARRAVIKVTPGKPLSDVLQEACTKLGLDSNSYGLRWVFNNLAPAAFGEASEGRLTPPLKALGTAQDKLTTSL